MIKVGDSAASPTAPKSSKENNEHLGIGTVALVPLCLHADPLAAPSPAIPKWLGVVLILIYAAFTGMGLLMEFGVILDGVSLFDKLSTEG